MSGTSKGMTIEKHYRMLKRAQEKFGMARFELGVVLETIREKELWHGKAQSFHAFLEEERLNVSAAYQYMRVARKLFFEMELSDKEFREIATVNMSTLDIACKLIDESNKEDILALVTVLSERDARHELRSQMDGEDVVEDRRIKKVLRHFLDLPDDLRHGFLQRLSRGSHQRPA